MAPLEPGTAGDSLAEMYRRHARSLVRLAALLVDDLGTAEEVMQDAFVRLHGAWDRVEAPEAYLRTSVVNLARSRLRRRAVARRHPPTPDLNVAPASDVVLAREAHHEVVDALRTLPRRQRECVVLRYYLDLSEAEIASTLGISTGSVKTHTHRALSALASKLRAHT
jgi:RNA polymerase sigma-70 factor (sigma-E family)